MQQSHREQLLLAHSQSHGLQVVDQRCGGEQSVQPSDLRPAFVQHTTSSVKLSAFLTLSCLTRVLKSCLCVKDAHWLRVRLAGGPSGVAFVHEILCDYC